MATKRSGGRALGGAGMAGRGGKVAAVAAAAAAGAAAAKAGVDARARRSERLARRFRLGVAEPVDDGLRRIARGQLDIAREGLDGDDKDGEGIHGARKALKRVRSALRLLRDQLGDEVYERENAALRDAGRRLSGPRDAQVIRDTLEALCKRHTEELEDGSLAGLRDALASNLEAERERLGEDSDAVEQAGDALEAERARIAAWQLSEDRSKLAPGLLRIYRRGRKAARVAVKDPSTENLHELRKRAKDLWYAARILRPVAPKRMRALGRDAHQVSDLIGEEHDLAVLDQHATHHRSQLPNDAAFTALEGLIARRRRELQRQALRRARRLYRAKPSKLARRWRAASPERHRS